MFFGHIHVLFIVQIILLLYGSLISYGNYKNSGNKHNFLQFYFIIFVLMLVGWVINYLNYFFGSLAFKFYTMIITVILFAMLFYGTIIFTRQK